jgi:pimeloyl-ACP methyl ester carboxylesterase
MRLPGVFLKVLLVWLLSVGVAWARPRTEVGELNGAFFRIDVPENWNGSLVMHCHGYRSAPGAAFDAGKPDRVAQVFGRDGYAVAQSGYSAGGYAVKEAVQDTEALRRYFERKHGVPKETWATGESMGGYVTMMLMEMFPDTYAGGLPLCAPLAPATFFVKTMVFDLLVLFEYFFPGQLPSPARVPSDFAMTLERPAALLRALDGKPAVAAQLRRFSTARTNKELSTLLDLYTYILKEMQQRWGGNAFDNRDTIYVGFDDDDAANEGVKRHAAHPRAAELASRYYTPTGRISGPMLAIRTIYDHVVPAPASNRYAEIAQQAGRGTLFAQKYVKGAGHCSIRPEEIRAGFAELRRWQRTGERPAPGALKVSPGPPSTER